MSTRGAVVVDEAVQYPPQLSLVTNQDLVEAFFAHAADPALGEGVRIWRLERECE
jgi:hypothetical protein